MARLPHEAVLEDGAAHLLWGLIVGAWDHIKLALKSVASLFIAGPN